MAMNFGILINRLILTVNTKKNVLPYMLNLVSLHSTECKINQIDVKLQVNYWLKNPHATLVEIPLWEKCCNVVKSSFGMNAQWSINEHSKQLIGPRRIYAMIQDVLEAL